MLKRKTPILGTEAMFMASGSDFNFNIGIGAGSLRNANGPYQTTNNTVIVFFTEACKLGFVKSDFRIEMVN